MFSVQVLLKNFGRALIKVYIKSLGVIPMTFGVTDKCCFTNLPLNSCDVQISGQQTIKPC